MDYKFNLAKESELVDIYELINQRIKWMDEVGIKQWNVIDYWYAYPKSYYSDEMKKGNLYVLKRVNDNKIVGAIVLLEKDEFWEDCTQVSAYYLHNFVTDINEKGVGKVILKCIEKLAIENKKSSLRLDCAKDNKILNKYYEKYGYVLVGECVDGPYYGNKREKMLKYLK